MARKLLTAALILTLALTAASCGTKNAGTSANRWNENDNLSAAARKADEGNGWADTARNESWGPLAEGSYAADNQGRVKGYDSSLNGAGLNTSGADAKDGTKSLADSAKDTAKDAAHKAKNAGDDIADGMKDAARSIGDAAEDALDNMTDHAKKATDNQNAANQNVQQDANGQTDLNKTDANQPRSY